MMTGDKPGDQSLSEQPSVLFEQVQAVCRNELVTLPINSVLALSVAFSVRHDVNPIEILAWLAAILVRNAVHYIATLRRLRPETLSKRLRAVQRANMIDSLFCSIIWCAVPAFMMNTAGQSPVIMLILAGMTSGATVGYCCSAANNTAFIFPVLATAALKYGFSGNPNNLILSFQIVFYLVFLINTSFSVEADFKRTVRLKLQATSLAASLEIEHASARATADRMFVLANTDHLTGLANRAGFSAKLSTWLTNPDRLHQGFFLFLLDLDHFKSINDTLGHNAGDIVLCEVAKRLCLAVETDAMVARLGGDEFAILLPAHGGDERATALAEHVLNAVTGDMEIGERLLTIGVSIGCAKFPDDAQTAEDLLARADLSLYAAKDAGRRRWRRFDTTLLATATIARDIEQDLPGAIADGSVQVWYQPQIALADLSLSGLEALLRWNHPVHGWIPPPLVVEAAQRTHKSEQLTGFVLAQACEQIRAIARAGFADVSVSVNISPRELSQYDVPCLIRQLLRTHDINPRTLELEITEEAFAASDEGIAALEALSATGVRLAIDDFGTGCSSLAYLRRMPVNRIKIDQAFVTGFADRPQDRILVRAVLGIGQSFGIEVVAEGVESAEEVTMLQSFGCDTAQGYHFGRPMRPSDLAAWMAAYPRKTPPLEGCVATTGIYRPSAIVARTAA